MKRQPRSAFTVFDLLLLLAILAVLLGLLFPIIAQVRRAAQRTQSANNMKQIALAMWNYHDATRRFPAGVTKTHFSALAQTLPYIEQAALAEQLDLKKPITNQANAKWAEVRITVFISPLDPMAGDTFKTGTNNYLFNAGSKYSLKDNNGIFYLESKTQIRDITDGTSNTIMAGESLVGDNQKKAATVARQHIAYDEKAMKTLNKKSGVADFQNNKNVAADRCSNWMDGRFLKGTFTGTRLINDSKPDVNCGGMGGLSGLRSLQRGTHIAMCDGSVRFVPDTVSAKSWKSLCSRNDGQAIGNDF
ncbi:MAG: DUF1559 domain-containing protein [Gemmataceae bacterium]